LEIWVKPERDGVVFVGERVALIYGRATGDADEQIADRLPKLVARHRKGTSPDDD